MSTVALTGGNGFLGWHTRLALLESRSNIARIPIGAAFNEDEATTAVGGAERVIHLAGVNRASDPEVSEGNLVFAQQLALALRRADRPPAVVAFANSTQAGNGSVYGGAKERAAAVLAEAAAAIGSRFEDVRLPNLFGEHGRPFYNAVTATFSHLLAEGGEPSVQQDRELTLLHAQNAADLLTGAVERKRQGELEVQETVSGLLSRLRGYARLYSRGEIPDLASDFDRDLFNTYRSYTFPLQAPVRLTRHADERGSFFEIIRQHGGTGQSSFSTTAPGVTRGDHFHRRKIERFTVLSGRGTISLRRLFASKVLDFPVNGEEPVAIDMPTGWAHRITNTGEGLLYTSFWTNDIFNLQTPDTIAEVV